MNSKRLTKFCGNQATIRNKGFDFGSDMHFTVSQYGISDAKFMMRTCGAYIIGSKRLKMRNV